jgi:hypothetical protein
LKKEGEEGSNTKTQKPKNTHDRKLRRIMNLERERERESQKGRKGMELPSSSSFVVSAKETCVVKTFIVGKKLGMALGGVKVWWILGVCICTL